MTKYHSSAEVVVRVMLLCVGHGRR